MRYRSQRENITPLWYIIGGCVVLFVISMAFPGVIRSFGLLPLDVASRPWTMLTSMFLHGGIGHLLGNMLTLYFFGTSAIELVGTPKFLLVYFAGGLAGNLLYVALAPPFALAVGASGAIFALGGLLVALVPKHQVVVFPVPVPMPLWAAVLGGFVILSFIPGVAWQAHLGGLVTGLAIGYAFKRRGK